MAKLTKSQTKLHNQACDLLEKDELTFDEKWFVLEHWHEGAEHINGQAGAFFTPVLLARDFSIDVTGPKVIDLCAGIGALSFMYYHCRHHTQDPQITCVEINPAYVEVGKKVLPEATWICADVFDDQLTLGEFDTAISNPPFGRVKASGRGSNYTGEEFEYKLIDRASELAEWGTFIMPQNSAGFRYSGAQYYERQDNLKYTKFHDQTNLHLEAGCGVDTTYYQDDWKCTNVLCEIVTVDFEDAKHAEIEQLALFA